MATFSSVNGSWHQLYTKGNNLKLPEREILTKDCVYFKKRPEPEVVEHMLDDLENKMRNYFILYNREREFRKKSEENCYRLEQELLEQKQKLEEANAKFHYLERKVKSMVDQPLKLKETIERIDLLYNQMDTLIQAFVGIGSCAVIQGYSRVAFIKLCLEYLYPCRDLDIRLNTLYTALYNVLTQYDGIEVTKNEVMKPMTQHPPERAMLTGISVKVHRLMLKCDLPETNRFSCYFRYDHESRTSERDARRLASVEVKELEKASKVFEFNSLLQNATLPPRVPNKLPSLVVDVYAEDQFVGSASATLISEKTLRPSEPWHVLDSNGVNCGDVVVTVLPIPDNAKLPAVNFVKSDELTQSNLPTCPHGLAAAECNLCNGTTAAAPNDLNRQAPTSGPAAKLERQPTTVSVIEPSAPAVKGEKPKENKPFEPKVQPTARKPLFNPKVAPSKAAQTMEKGKQSNVSKLSQMFGGKKQSDAQPEKPAPAAPKTETTVQEPKEEAVKAETAPELKKAESTKEAAPVPVKDTPVEVPKELPKEPVKEVKLAVNEVVEDQAEKEKKSSIKNLIIKKLSTKPVKDTPKETSPTQEKETEVKAEPTPAPTAPVAPKIVPKAKVPLAEAATDAAAPAPPAPKAVSTPAPPSPPTAKTPAVEDTAAKLPPPANKAVPSPPVTEPAAANPPTATDNEPGKPLLPIVIQPKLLKKPGLPKRK